MQHLCLSAAGDTCLSDTPIASTIFFIGKCGRGFARKKSFFSFQGHNVALRLFFHTYVATRLTGPSCDLVCPTSPAQYLNVTNCPPSNDNSPVLLRGIARVAIIITTTIYDSEYTATRSAILPATMQHTVTAEAIDYMERDLYNQYSNISIRRLTRRVL